VKYGSKKKPDRGDGGGRDTDSVYVSPNDLMKRWACSRATADRIARRAGLTRVFLGEGKHGIVRFLFSEVREWEESRKGRDAY